MMNTYPQTKANPQVIKVLQTNAIHKELPL